MSERQRQTTWAEIQERQRSIETRQTIASLEAALAAVEAQLPAAQEEEGKRRAASEQAGWAMVVALDRRDPGASLLADVGDPERAPLDAAEAELVEMTRVVGDLQARRARLRQMLTHLRGAVAAA